MNMQNGRALLELFAQLQQQTGDDFLDALSQAQPGFFERGGAREEPRPAEAKREIPKLKTFKLSQVEVNNLKECCICYGSFEEGMEVYDVACYHIFHKQCLEEWWQREPSCPVCRVEHMTDATGNHTLRSRRINEWEAQRVDGLRSKPIDSLSNADLRTRLQDLRASVPPNCPRQELIELVLMLDPKMGVRVRTEEADGGAESSTPVAPAQSVPQPEPEPEPAPPTTKEMLKYLRSKNVSTQGIAEKAELTELYLRHRGAGDVLMSPPVPEPQPQPQPQPQQQQPRSEHRVNGISFGYLETLATKDLVAVVQAHGVDTSGVVERQELLSLLTEAIR